MGPFYFTRNTVVIKNFEPEMSPRRGAACVVGSRHRHVARSPGAEIEDRAVRRELIDFHFKRHRSPREAQHRRRLGDQHAASRFQRNPQRRNSVGLDKDAGRLGRVNRDPQEDEAETAQKASRPEHSGLEVQNVPLIPASPSGPNSSQSVFRA